MVIGKVGLIFQKIYTEPVLAQCILPVGQKLDAAILLLKLYILSSKIILI